MRLHPGALGPLPSLSVLWSSYLTRCCIRTFPSPSFLPCVFVHMQKHVWLKLMCVFLFNPANYICKFTSDRLFPFLMGSCGNLASNLAVQLTFLHLQIPGNPAVWFAPQTGVVKLIYPICKQLYGEDQPNTVLRSICLSVNRTRFRLSIQCLNLRYSILIANSWKAYKQLIKCPDVAAIDSQKNNLKRQVQSLLDD